MERTIAVTIETDVTTNTFTVNTLEGESGLTKNVGRFNIEWFDRERFYQAIGKEIMSWALLMMDEDEDDDDDE